jgi:hypothetical protein
MENNIHVQFAGKLSFLNINSDFIKEFILPKSLSNAKSALLVTSINRIYRSMVKSIALKFEWAEKRNIKSEMFM